MYKVHNLCQLNTFMSRVGKQVTRVADYFRTRDFRTRDLF